jgi:hypothetical protein
MNGYLMQEREWTPGQDLFVDSFSPENVYGVVFEDDGDAAYFYAVEKDKEGAGLRVLDALHIFETEGSDEEDPTAPSAQTPDSAAPAVRTPEAANDADDDDRGNRAPAGAPAPPSKLLIVWSKDWQKCALVIAGLCHAIFDFKEQAGYNINEFPPPNDFWTKGDRKITIERLRNFQNTTEE